MHLFCLSSVVSLIPSLYFSMSRDVRGMKSRAKWFHRRLVLQLTVKLKHIVNIEQHWTSTRDLFNALFNVFNINSLPSFSTIFFSFLKTLCVLYYQTVQGERAEQKYRRKKHISFFYQIFSFRVFLLSLYTIYFISLLLLISSKKMYWSFFTVRIFKSKTSTNSRNPILKTYTRTHMKRYLKNWEIISRFHHNFTQCNMELNTVWLANSIH